MKLSIYVAALVASYFVNSEWWRQGYRERQNENANDENQEENNPIHGMRM